MQISRDVRIAFIMFFIGAFCGWTLAVGSSNSFVTTKTEHNTSSIDPYFVKLKNVTLADVTANISITIDTWKYNPILQSYSVFLSTEKDATNCFAIIDYVKENDQYTIIYVDKNRQQGTGVIRYESFFVTWKINEHTCVVVDK